MAPTGCGGTRAPGSGRLGAAPSSPGTRPRRPERSATTGRRCRGPAGPVRRFCPALPGRPSVSWHESIIRTKISHRMHRMSRLWPLLGSCVLLLLLGVSPWGLWERDEGRYADVAREMLERSDYITPRINGAVFLDKPPLVYWVTAASMSLWGD